MKVQYQMQMKNASHIWIPDKILQHAQMIPDKVAIISQEGTYTYREIQEFINKKCEEIVSLGINQSHRVGLCLKRTSCYPIAVIALLKLNITFVPLSLDYPTERLKWMIADAGINFIISDFDHFPLPRIYNDKDNIDSKINDDFAYIIYTSGSTGMPKGVLIRYDSLNYCTKEILEAVGISAQDICLHVAPFSFSASMRQLFLPLVKGATLAIASEEQRQNPRKIWEFILKNKITIFNTSPYYLKTCLVGLNSFSFEEKENILKNNVIRLLLSASEPFEIELARKWYEDYGQSSQIINLYGQTETTGVLLTYHLEWSSQIITNRILPLGYPIPGTIVMVEDENKILHVNNAEGQIIIAGLSIKGEYIHQSSLHVSPFKEINWQGKTIKIYYTGDFGYLDKTGCAHFRHRKDQQIKIRGQRIDVHEIEYIMKKFLPILDAVIFIENNPHPFLVAHIAFLEQLLPNDEIKKTLSNHLPIYMIPDYFILYHAFPKNVNGKLDRITMRSKFYELLNMANV